MIVKKYNFDFDSSTVEDDWTVWRGEPNDKHAWAFIHWCRRHGHVVYVKGDDRWLNIAVRRPLDFTSG